VISSYFKTRTATSHILWPTRQSSMRLFALAKALHQQLSAILVWHGVSRENHDLTEQISVEARNSRRHGGDAAIGLQRVEDAASSSHDIT
jgi:hypothetical protein